MNILFIASMPVTSLHDRGIFPDLVREFAYRGHTVYAVSACERREGRGTSFSREDDVYVLQVRTLNNRRVSFIEKGLAVVTTPFLLGRAIIRRLKGSAIDLIIYSTPPITIYPLIASLKKRFRAPTYLILKDIWPQAMIDLSVIKKGGFSCRAFEWLARKLYSVSDFIGTMSAGNSALLLELYPHIPGDKVEVCPNSSEPSAVAETPADEKKELLESHGVPDGAVVFSYGGSFNKPQGIPFLIEALESWVNDDKVFFFLCGAGTDYSLVEDWCGRRRPRNIKLLPYLSKEEYFDLLRISDVGLVFLDPRFTVPNMPSRALDYMEFSLPIIAAVDDRTDFRAIIEEGGFGLGSIAGDLRDFRSNVERMFDSSLRENMGGAGRRYLERHWTASIACDIVLRHFTSPGP